MMIEKTFAKQFGYLKKALISGKLHHSYIFYGPKESGKFDFAVFFARYIQCLDNEKESPCEKCKNCKVSKDGFIVDTYIINKGKSETITISEIRELQKSTDLTVGEGRRKIFIINNAQNITREAKEALLKTLEEPSGNSLIILITDEKKLLPQTVLSRCPALFFPLKISNLSLTEKIGKEEFLNLAEELEIFLDKSLFSKMVLVKDLSLDKESKSKVEKWILVLHQLLIAKNGLLEFSDEDREVLKNLEKNLDCDRIIKVLEDLHILLNNLDTNASKRVLFEDFVLHL